MMGCDQSDNENVTEAAKNISLSWELMENRLGEQPSFKARFVFHNQGDHVLGSQNWAVYFNQTPRTIDQSTISAPVKIEQLSGDFFQLKPTEGFELPAGDSLEVSYEGGYWLTKEVDAPLGVYLVTYDEEGNELDRIPLSYEVKPFVRESQTMAVSYEPLPYPDAGNLYQENQSLKDLGPQQYLTVIPQPVTLRKGNTNLVMDNQWKIGFQPGLDIEADYLKNFLSNETGLNLSAEKAEQGGDKVIYLQVDNLSIAGKSKEAYKVQMDEGITITGNDPAGVFYGIQSLLKLIPLNNFFENSANIDIPSVMIEDAPAFEYRGMHLDVARHFMEKEYVYKLIDAMAFYKLNKLHFHLTDDEGWRLEIEGLPELTQVGAVRGHTLDEQEFLHPSYGSGPDPEENIAGSGFYSREEYIDMLKYAFERHIDVIPEINMPGHARAAIVAMNARRQRLLDEGKNEEADRYWLSEPEDESSYYSAQGYTDNVVNVCKDAPYEFYATVLDDLIEMYQEAGAPLNMIHSGGDEVPVGVWEKSPLCQEFLQESTTYSQASELQSYFLSRINELAKERNLQLAGWEEVALQRNEDGSLVVNPEFVEDQVVPYVWNNLWGNQDLGYRLANAGYPVVLCNVTNFYFDLAYNRHPEEPGLYWGGFVDTKDAYDMYPYDVFKSTKEDASGVKFNAKVDFADMERLKPEAKENIIGLQGQLWSETLQNGEMMEYYYLPKMLGLAERAWFGHPDWADLDDDAAREASLNEDWNQFANALGKIDMPRLDYVFGGYNFRVPPPGLVIEGDQLKANVAYPGLIIRYTTDGSEPNQNSPEYQGPVQVEGEVKAKAFTLAGKSSRTSSVSANDQNNASL